MDSKQALDFINNLLVTNAKEVLNELEEKIFLGCWEGRTYDEISITVSFSVQYLRDVGSSQLFKKIGSELGIKVSKRNFKNPIEYKYQQDLLQNSGSDKKSISKQQEQVNTSGLNSSLLQKNNGFNNPFNPTSGKIRDSQYFFSREREIQQIFEVLNSGSSIVLIGEEGIGKSSLLEALCREANHYLNIQRQSVLIDLNDIENDEDFYIALCHEVGIPECAGQMLTRNLRKHENKILLALDNVGKMTSEAFTKNLRDKLRSLADGGEPLKLILVANESLTKLFNDSLGRTSPLAGICQEYHVLMWNESTIREFINQRLELTPIQFREEEIVQIINSSRGHPRELMQMCNRIYNQYRGK
jgi:AAA domain